MTALVADTSAIIGIIAKEPGWERIVDAIHAASERIISTATELELALVVVGRRGTQDNLESLDRLLRTLCLEARPVDRKQIHIAREAFLKFGKGRHPAALNFGDCFSYALAKSLQARLLFVGNDFARTDIEAVLSG